MYKGKFDQKNKKRTAGTQEAVSRRIPDPVLDEADLQPLPRKQAAPAQRSAAPQKAPAPQTTPVKKAPAPAQPKQTPVQEAPKKKKGPRLGGVIFYTLYFMFILVFFLATYIGLSWLNNWLTDYEMAQPVHKAEQVFTQLFTNPNWGDLYEAAGAEDSLYEGKEEYVAYMEAKTGSQALTYLQTSAGLSGDKKYVVRLNDENVATFTLTDKNAQEETTLENISEIPDWQLSAVEVFFDRPDSYLIEVVDGHIAYVNDVPLTDDHTIQIATTLAEKYLPAGTRGASMCTQQVTGLMCLPTVKVLDADGNPMEVTYDEATKTFTERTEANTIVPEQEEVALNAAKAFCLWMIEEGNRADIAKYYDASSEVYNEIIRTTELWMQNHNGYTFADESVTKFAMYNDNMFSVRVALTLKVTRTDGTVKDYPFGASLFFRKTDNGSWKVFEKTNVDVSQPVGKVRLTFMHNGQMLTSDFYATDAKEITTPSIAPAPEGKVLSGWVRQTVNEEGDTVLTIVFQPDETNKVYLPSGSTLEPMVLYSLFQTPEEAAASSAAQSAPQETPAPETTEGA